MPLLSMPVNYIVGSPLTGAPPVSPHRDHYNNQRWQTPGQSEQGYYRQSQPNSQSQQGFHLRGNQNDNAARRYNNQHMGAYRNGPVPVHSLNQQYDQKHGPSGYWNYPSSPVGSQQGLYPRNQQFHGAQQVYVLPSVSNTGQGQFSSSCTGLVTNSGACVSVNLLPSPLSPACYTSTGNQQGSMTPAFPYIQSNVSPYIQPNVNPYGGGLRVGNIAGQTTPPSIPAVFPLMVLPTYMPNLQPGKGQAEKRPDGLVPGALHSSHTGQSTGDTTDSGLHTPASDIAEDMCKEKEGNEPVPIAASILGTVSEERYPNLSGTIMFFVLVSSFYLV